MQLRAGIRKEWMEVLRTKRIIVMSLGMLIFAFLNPLMVKSLPYLVDWSNSVVEGAGMENGGTGLSVTVDDSLVDGNEGAMDASAFESDNLGSVYSYITTAADLGLLAVLLGLMRAAGGDQKNKRCVIPLCLGYKRTTYMYAKFAVYPLVSVLVTTVTFFIAYGFSSLLFPDGSLPIMDVWLPLLALNLFILFNVCLMLFIGCSTGKAGIGALCIYIVNMIMSFVMIGLDWQKYHPYALGNYYQPFVGGFPEKYIQDFAITGGVTLLICVVLCILTVNIFKRKRLV